ncbi:type II secretion system F family protein [Corynebacterium halotolerans]|uniref:Type II secretion system protein GspF domain-containing protein n=1 Tax=Corynebacterium halotolerans YIM 70093 = DSM 44683 TaxID=1121362 RepID=M1NV26_9CORY|nr:type II secretion system F family protein [Corynebacterium halotolerans]AGF71355.1 hypothetical protein A605_01705 [Corynebacterium halotolerans YIM 70093 = DSM 44683]
MTAVLLLAAALIPGAPNPAGRITRGGRPRHLPGALVPAAVFVGVVVFLTVGRLSVAVATLIAVATAVWSVRELHRGRRARRRQAATATFLGHLVGQLRAGSALPQAITSATEQLDDHAPAELAEVLRTTAGHTRRGGEGAGLLLEAGGSVPELAAVGTLWRIADRHGIPLAPLMEQAQARLDARARHRAATTAALQGPQATAVVLTLLPVAGIGMGTAMGADPLGFLFGGGLGGILLVAGVGLAAGGFLWSRHLIAGAAA